MAVHPLLTALLFALALSSVELSTCQVLKGKVSCSDCSSKFDLSGIKVLVKCDKVKKLAVATTEVSGSFQVELPSDDAKTPNPSNCLAKLLGGPVELYISKKNTVAKVVKANDNSKSYKISAPLAFSISCPSTLKGAKCKASNKFGSSKTVDVPLPRDWGLPPSSYYVPFIPIIGIP